MLGCRLAQSYIVTLVPKVSKSKKGKKKKKKIHKNVPAVLSLKIGKSQNATDGNLWESQYNARLCEGVLC